MDPTERRITFLAELVKLKVNNFITEEDYDKLQNAYNKYYELNKPDPTAAPISTPKSNTFKLRDRSQDNMRPDNNYTATNINNYTSTPPISNTFHTNKPKSQYKTLSPQEVKERNITLILILGVSFILLSGLILATSTWDLLNNGFKTILLTLVTLFFFGTSLFAEKVLKIEKTSFAFWALGSLLLPIMILSIGYFKLFGNYLSLFGDGKYILGIIGTTICLAVYVLSALRYKNRLFVWFSFITFSIKMIFLVSLFKPSIDIFYFAIAIFNGLLLLSYYKLKAKESLTLFLKEMPLFVQGNLIVTTLFMFFQFNNPNVYGFNLILTALLYLFIVFSQGPKEYSYVFSALFIYGIYQIVEHTPLASIDILIFPLTAFIFVIIELYTKNQETLKRIFNYISAFISLCSFIYIIFKGFSTEYSHFIVLISYLFITLNYVYISYTVKNKIIGAAVPLFLTASLYEFYFLIRGFSINYNLAIHLLIVSFILFYFLFYKNNYKYTLYTKEGSAIVSLLTLLYSFMLSITKSMYVTESISLFVVCLVLYLISKKITNASLCLVINWSVPPIFFLSLLILYFKLHASFYSYGFIIHFGLAVLVLYLLSFILERFEEEFGATFFYSSHMVMPISILLLFINYYSKYPFIFLIPLVIYCHSLLISSKEWLIRSFLYLAFITGTLAIYSTLFTLKFSTHWLYYAISISCIIIAVIWYISNEEYKRRIHYFVIPFSCIGVFALSSYQYYGVTDFIFSILFTTLTLFIAYKEDSRIVEILPLLAFMTNIHSLSVIVFHFESAKIVIVLSILFLVFKLIGEKLSSILYNVSTEGKGFFVDWYSTFSLFIIIYMSIMVTKASPLYIKLIPPILLVYMFFSQIKRVNSDLIKKIFSTLTVTAVLYLYYVLIFNIKIPSIINTELNVLPWIVFVIYASKKIWNSEFEFMRYIEIIVLILVSFILLKDILLYSYLADVLILCSLSLVSIIIGMQLKLKTYLYVGSGTIILTVLLKTRHFWGNLPWWVYLLIIGLVLLSFASLTEMKKKK
ncbi:MAG: hypothetical protein AB6733_21050 [Clostridiaceae bacterium]